MDDPKVIQKKQTEWENSTLKEWVDKFGERQKEFRTFQGMVPVKTVYTPNDLEEKGIDFLRDIGFPGEFPYTRGNEPNMYRRKFWEMSQYSGFGSADETNQRIKDLLNRGLSGIFIALDLPTQIGYDSDHPMARKEVGKTGVAVDSLEDMERMFAGIPLNRLTSVRTTANTIAPIWIALLVGLCEKQGIDPNSIHGVTQNDVLKEFACRGTQIFPIKPHLRFTTDAVEFCVKNLPNWSPLQISGDHIVSMGARNIEGVAFSLADAIQYLHCALERGLDIDEVASKNEFLVSARGEAFFDDVAKFRAIRKLWAKILKERFGAKNPASLKMNIIGFGSGASLTRQEPINNIVRTTLQCLVLALSGVPSINLPSYDEALSTPSQDAARIALRTQQIVAHETGIADTADPLGGSYFLECLTCEVEKKAMEIIKKIDELGMAAAAIEKGFYERLINRGIYDYEREFESGGKVKVAVNKFQTDDEVISIKAFRGKPEEEEKQKMRLADLRRRRNNRAVTQSLRLIAEKAKGDENLVPPILEALKNYATLGEICNALREVWGDWKAKPSLAM
jgi:methylmalonyl-CoA mutase N-terminal domain/subunit